MSVAVGPDQIVAAAGEQEIDLIFNLGGEHLGSVFADIGYALLLTSLLAAMIAFHNITARYGFSLGRERVLPAGLLTRRSGADVPDVSLLALARDTARRLACLRPDLEAGDEQILTSLAQFDFLTCLAAVAGRGNEVFSGVFYPSFAWVRGARTQPIAERLLREPELRTMIYPGDDPSLAAALHNIDHVAQREGFRFDGWEGYTEPVVRFIHEHHVPAGDG